MKKLHSALVSAYMLGGLTIMATAEWSVLLGMASSPGSTLAGLHPAAGLAEIAVHEATQANASMQLMFGILLFTLGGFMHAFYLLRHERPVHVTVKPKKARTLFWLEMRI